MESVRELQKRARARLKTKREEYPFRVTAWWKEVMRDRIAATKALVEFRGLRGDFHSHSTHSDGVGTVAEMAAMRDASGMDFLFVTDHWGLTQRRECQAFDKIWWGQEPGTQYHHLGTLGLQKRFVPEGDLVRDVNRVKELGGIPFIPHPAGWFPSTRYTQEQKDALGLLGDEFIIEIINGANQVFDAYDITDEQSIELWDKHLCMGKRVSAMGNSDAHLPHGVGDIWTGVLPEEPTMEGVLDAVRRGRTFVSDAPIVDLTLQADGGPISGMGETFTSKNRPVTVRVLAADSLGLQTVRLIRDGEVIRTWQPGGKQVVSQCVVDDNPAGTGEQTTSYYRMECLAVDGRRAYTNPIYVR